MRPNLNTLPLIEDMISWSTELGINVKKKDKATLIDCSDGGYDAGAFFAEVCLGGVGTVGFTEKKINEIEFPSVQVHTDLPVFSCLNCQKADLVIGEKIASGPGKLLLEKDESFDRDIDDEEYCILALETSEEPSDSMIKEVSERFDVEKKDIFLIYAPTNSLVGSVQISARIIETALHKLNRKNCDLSNIKQGFGTAPIAPVSNSTKEALGRTNDAIIYGGSVTLHVENYSTEFEELASKNSDKYGKLMKTVYEEVNYDFQEIDQDFFAPAEALINTTKTGKLHKFGEKNPEILMKSFDLEV